MEKGIISVDRWSECSQAYFLTHLHADHTKGLSPKWKKGPLFCSSVSAKLFPSKFPGFKLSLLRILEIGSTYTFSLFSPSSGLDISVQVTAIDANHCPGAVMYLFRGEFGCTLYTGDFRWEGASERTLMGKTMLLNAIGSDKIDTLYLDNTYCNPVYSFPPREVVAQQVIDIIVSHPKHQIVIAINTLGKEDLLLRISRALKTKIWVWPERLQTMHLLGLQAIFTTDTHLTRIRAIPFYSFSINTLEELNLTHPTIGIMPSGLPWVARNSNPTENIYDRKSHPYIYSVPYSDHSCFKELHDFVKLMQPLSMKGIVASSCCYISPLFYLGYLCQEDKVDEEPSKIFQRRKGKAIVGVDFSLKEERYMKLHRVCTSRVSVLRRRRRGTKIVESIDPD